MATSKFSVNGAYHSRVYCSGTTGEYFILKPDLRPKDTGDWDQLKVYQVHPHPRSDPNATYQVFTEGDRREDLETGMRMVGAHWGTHTIIEKGANPDWAELESFKTAFQGTGCLLFLIALPLAVLAISASIKTANWL